MEEKVYFDVLIDDHCAGIPRKTRQRTAKENGVKLKLTWDALRGNWLKREFTVTMNNKNKKVD